jgi:hypothetical protein
MKTLIGSLFLTVAVFGLTAPTRAEEKKAEPKKAENRVFELRIYTAEPGKMEALKARFRDHTTFIVLTITCAASTGHPGTATAPARGRGGEGSAERQGVPEPSARGAVRPGEFQLGGQAGAEPGGVRRRSDVGEEGQQQQLGGVHGSCSSSSPGASGGPSSPAATHSINCFFSSSERAA